MFCNNNNNNPPAHIAVREVTEQKLNILLEWLYHKFYLCVRYTTSELVIQHESFCCVFVMIFCQFVLLKIAIMHATL